MSNTAKKVAASPLNVLLRWVDSWHNGGTTEENPEGDYKIDWVRTTPFFLMHVACLGVIWVGFSWVALAVCLGLYAIRIFAITGFYHRYFSHRAFKTNRFWQFVFAAVGGTAVQRGPLWWAAHHRHHHRHSDKEDDVHSPHEHSFMWSHMLWITSRPNFPTRLHEVKDLAKYPELRFLDRFDIIIPVILAVGLFFLGMGLNALWPQLGTSGLQMLVWGFFVSTVIVFHATCTINSLSHLFGSRRYETTDKSRNNFWLALLTFGEGWHNNHHHYPAAARQGFFWWEIDATYYVLKVFEKIGIIWDMKDVPGHVREGGRKAVLQDSGSSGPNSSINSTS